MHRVFEIPEILLNIFGHLYTPGISRPLSDLPALARTCRTFKEPALDVLWEDLPSLSPLLRCLPEVSHEISTGHESRIQNGWDNLRRYACRVRSVAQYLKVDHRRILYDHRTTEPLFPNLRHLRCTASTVEAMPLLYLPFPSLISLDVVLGNKSMLREYLESLPTFSPDFRELSICLQDFDHTFIEIDQHRLCHWRNLQILVCPQVTLNVDTLVHLSSLTSLTQLNFALDAMVPALDSPITFSHLHTLTLHSKRLSFVESLLSQTGLPAVTSFIVFVDNPPSEKRLHSLWRSIEKSGISRTIRGLRLHQSTPSRKTRGDDPLVLGLDHLQPCMAFSNLRYLDLNIEWSVDLTDSDLLTLASAWPRLKKLFINLDWGWDTFRGITPDGLVRLLQTCPSLSHIAIAIDTCSDTKYPQSAASLWLTPSRWISVDVVDSYISQESVPAIIDFFVDLGPCHMKSDMYSNFSASPLEPEAWHHKGTWENIFYQKYNDVCQYFSETRSSDSLGSDIEIEPPREWVRWVRSSQVRMGE